MASNFQKIEAFSKAAGVKRPSFPAVPDFDILHFRQRLITEEFEEVCQAISDLSSNDKSNQHDALSQLAHELADLLYVVYGTFSACGIDADAVFEEIHRANMAKVDGPRRADGKLLKPNGWQPADVATVLNLLADGR